MPASSDDETELHDATRRRVGQVAGHADGRDQQGERQREQADAGRDRGEPERDRQEERHHEEQPGLQQVLEEEHREPALELRVVEHRGIDQRLAFAGDQPAFPREEHPEDEAARRA